MINSIRLNNWRSHENTELKFKKGTNLLVGIMGSGKSSVLDAISFALFGTFPALERRKLKTTDLIRFDQDGAAVDLKFHWNGSDYLAKRRITRTKKGSSSTAEISKDGNMIDTGPKAVTAYVEQLLGIDYDLFTRAIYSEQNNTDYFLTLDPRKRKLEMDSLLGLDRFENARSNVVSVINRIRSNRKFMEQKFNEKRLEELEERKKRISEKSEALRKSLEDIQAKLKQKKEELDKESEHFNLLRSKKQKHDSAKNELLQLKGYIESLEKELQGHITTEEEYVKQKKANDELSGKQSILKKSLEEIGKNHLFLIKKTARLESEIKALGKSAQSIRSMEKELADILKGKTGSELVNEAESVDKEIIALNSEKTSLANQIKELEKVLLSLRPGISECPICGNVLGIEHMEKISKEKSDALKRAKERAASINRVMPDKNSYRDRIIKMIKRSDNLSEKIESLTKEQDALPELNSEFSRYSRELKENEEKKQSMEKSLEELSTSIQAKSRWIDQQKSLFEKREKMEDARRRCESIQKQIGEMAFDESSFDRSRSRMEGLRLATERLSMESKSFKKEFDSISEMLPLVEGELVSLKETQDQIRRSSNLEDELAIFKNGLLETQLSLRNSLTDAINKAMNEIWSIFYPYRNYSSIRISITEKDYLFEVYDRGEWKPLESIASGGERASAALTLRVALAMVLTPTLSWLILDEPTHNLDKEAISLLSDTLQSKVPEVVNQTFVITHEEDLMGSDFASSYRLEREKGISGPSRYYEI